MRHILIMGVCGTGKSTVAQGLAEALGLTFVEADTHHAPEAVARMAQGMALTDADRWGWLDRVATAAGGSSDGSVIACSALKQAYRTRLRAALGEFLTVHLKGSPALIASRMASRTGHFMPTDLIDSQFADLEPPAGRHTLTLDIALPSGKLIVAARDFARGQADAPANDTTKREETL